LIARGLAGQCVQQREHERLRAESWQYDVEIGNSASHMDRALDE
jgi:hypothetical protein